MSIPRCPGRSEYGHGFHRTVVHHGCCVQVLDQDLLRQGDRYVLVLDVGHRRTQLVVAPADSVCTRWCAYVFGPDGIDFVASGGTERAAAAALDRHLRAAEELLAEGSAR